MRRYVANHTTQTPPMGAIHHTTVIAYYPDNLPNTIAGLGTLCYTIGRSTRLNMHIFDYQTAPAKLLTPEITALLSAIHEFKGKQELYLNAKPDILNALVEVARSMTM